MPVRPLPNDPSLEHLRKEAKRLRVAVRGGDSEALAKVREFHPRAGSAIESFALADAQLVTARAYGFASWARLRQHLAAIAPVVWNPPRRPEGSARADAFIWLACLTYAGCTGRTPTRPAACSTMNRSLRVRISTRPSPPVMSRWCGA